MSSRRSKDEQRERKRDILEKGKTFSNFRELLKQKKSSSSSENGEATSPTRSRDEKNNNNNNNNSNSSPSLVARSLCSPRAKDRRSFITVEQLSSIDLKKVSDSNNNNDNNGNIKYATLRSTSGRISSTPISPPSTPPRIPQRPKVVASLPAEEIDSLLAAVKKFLNSVKQLIAVAKSLTSKAEKITNNSKLQIITAQMGIARSDVEEPVAAIFENIKTFTMGSGTKTLPAVTKIYVEMLPPMLSLIPVLINGMRQIAKQMGDETTTKQILKSATTMRDYTSAFIEDLSKYATYIDGDRLFPQLSKLAENAGGMISSLIEISGTNSGTLIHQGRRLEMEAAARVVIVSVHKLVMSFSVNIGESIINETKVASSTILQLIATLNEVISSSPYLISLPEVKQQLVEHAVKLKQQFENFITQAKSQITNYSPQSSFKTMIEVEEPLFRCIKDLLLSVLNFSEVDMKGEVSAARIGAPSSEICTRVDKIVTVPTGGNLSHSPDNVNTDAVFDYPDDYVPDIENIWDEPEEEDGRVIPGETENSIKCGTLNALIRAVTHSKYQDLKFAKTFITTFRSFTTSETFFKKLMQRFHVPPSSAESTLPIQLRVCNVMKMWVDAQCNDFSGDLLTQLEDFLCELDLNKNYSKFASSIRSTLLKSKELQKISQNEILNLTFETKIPLSPSNILFVFEEEEIARQLTLVDFRIYQAIKPEELLNQAWNKPKYKHRAKNVLSLIARSTAITKWVASVILWQETLKGRTRMITKMINIAEHLRKLNNFNSIMAIISGINTSAVYRLKLTKSGIPPQTLEIFDSLQVMMNPAGSYANYRSHLRSANPPLVPFLGTYLTDITFIEDGNQDYFKGLINFRKREFNYNVIQEIQQYQSIGYNFTIIDNIAHYLTEIPFIENENDLYSLSLIREPKNATPESIP